jgi:hypothetical protein
MSKIAVQWMLVRIALAGITLAYFAPLIASYPLQRIPSPYPDALEFIWTTWRMQGVLQGQRQLYETHELFAPEGASLLLHTVCEGLLLPVTAVFRDLDPVWRFNSAVLVAFLANGVAATSLMRILGASPILSMAGSLLIVFSPFQMGHLLAGHLNFLVLFPLLEVCTALVAFGQQGRSRATLARYALRCAFAVFLLGRTNLYYLYFAALLVGLFSLQYSITRALTRQRLAALWCACAVGMLCNVQHLARIAQMALSRRYTPDHNPLTTSADFVAYFIPSSLQLLGGWSMLAGAREGVKFHEGETSLYIGLCLLIALWIASWHGLRNARREIGVLLVVVLASVLASFGPVLTISGVALSANPLDYVARSILPLYPSVPARFAGVAQIFIVSLVVVGWRVSNSQKTRRVLEALCFLALVELVPTQCSLTSVELQSPALERLSNNPSIRTVVDQPAITQRAMARQVLHGKNLVGGFLSRRPRKQERELRNNAFLQSIRPNPRQHPVEERRQGWCMLQADGVIVESAMEQQFKQALLEAGLHKIDGDEVVSIFSALGPCEKGNEPPT